MCSGYSQRETSELLPLHRIVFRDRDMTIPILVSNYRQEKMDDIIYRQNNELFEYKVMLGFKIGMNKVINIQNATEGNA